MVYSYTKSPASLDRLYSEIESSIITVALDKSLTIIFGDQLTIAFKASISSEEKDILDGIISSHDGTPLDENIPTSVKIEDLAKSQDDKLIIHQTSRPIGTFTYFTGASDSDLHEGMVGGDVSDGKKLKLHMESGVSEGEALLELNNIINETSIHEGYFQWKNALNDDVTLEIVPKITSYNMSTNPTGFMVYGNNIIPHPAGQAEITDLKLVQCVENEQGIRPPGYWNATYNVDTNQFENITAANGNGEYNIFVNEIPLFRFANQLPALGDGFIMLQSSDYSKLGHNLAIKLKAKTCGNAHEWWCSAFLTFYRKKTC